MYLIENIESTKSCSKLFSLLFALISKHRLLRRLEVQDRKPLSWNKPLQCVKELRADFQKRRFCFGIKPTPSFLPVYFKYLTKHFNARLRVCLIDYVLFWCKYLPIVINNKKRFNDNLFL